MVQQGHGHPLGHGGEQRRLEVGALAGAGLAVQRLGDGERGADPGADVDDAHPDPAVGPGGPDTDNSPDSA